MLGMLAMVRLLAAVSTLASLSVCALMSGRARAAEPPDVGSEQSAPDTFAPPATRGAWYGWQVAIADAIAVPVFAAGAISSGGIGRGPLALLGAAGYLVGGPVVHFAHGQAGRSAASFTLRIGAPGTLVLLLGVACPRLPSCPVSSSAGGLIGLGTGMAAAITLDAIWAREPIAHRTPAAPGSPVVVALARRSEGGALLVMEGAF